MNYFIIIGKISEDSGIYGRKESIFELQKDRGVLDHVLQGVGIAAAISAALLGGGGPIGWIALAGVGLWPKNQIFAKKSPIIKLTEGEKNEKKVIWIPNKSLWNNYDIKDEEILYGFFKNNKQFKKIMQSQGGHSNLFIVERDDLPDDIVHYGGKNGIYSYGLYCEHPKNRNMLLPMEDFKNIIKTRIIEETIRVYEALGAEEITIEDLTEYNAENKANVYKKADIKGDMNYKKAILQNKKYEKGVFDPEHAFDDIYFIPDIDSIMTVANARIKGNQLVDEFTETIHLGLGLDVDILNIFDNKANFKYDRTWYFSVKFFDKNKLHSVKHHRFSWQRK